MKFAEGYPKTLTKRYRNDSLLSLSDRQRGGSAGYGIAECRVHSPEEERQAREEGFGDTGQGMRYPVVLELGAIPGGAPKQQFTASSDQQYADICAQGWTDGRTVTRI
jgi:hypothetical protein